MPGHAGYERHQIHSPIPELVHGKDNLEAFVPGVVQIWTNSDKDFGGGSWTSDDYLPLRRLVCKSVGYEGREEYGMAVTDWR
jgi:hypothetical protein